MLLIKKSAKKRHGRCNTPEWITWVGMLQRCAYPRHTHFKHYGGRGISMDPRWSDFSEFFSDMGERPPGMSLDRINPDGHYCKDNCRWATASEQSRNRRVRNPLGVAGIYFYPERGGHWKVICKDAGRQKQLYWGADLFEAFCARKAWEARC